MFRLIERQLMRDIQKGGKDDGVSDVGNSANVVSDSAETTPVEDSQIHAKGVAVRADATVS